jgi:hypothetical protein
VTLFVASFLEKAERGKRVAVLRCSPLYLLLHLKATEAFLHYWRLGPGTSTTQRFSSHSTIAMTRSVTQSFYFTAAPLACNRSGSVALG